MHAWRRDLKVLLHFDHGGRPSVDFAIVIDESQVLVLLFVQGFFTVASRTRVPAPAMSQGVFGEAGFQCAGSGSLT